jgi:DNA-binding response OmpR family regulator
VGHRCLLATTAAKARVYMSAVSPDLIITDVLLPGGGGLALAEELRRNNVPVIITTGSPESIEKLEDQGLPFLAKPFRLHDLLSAIEAGLRSKRDHQHEMTNPRAAGLTASV